LKLLVQECSNKEIAAQLNISPRTVKQHLRTLFLRGGHSGWPQARETSHRHARHFGLGRPDQPRDREPYRNCGTSSEKLSAQRLRQLGVWSRLDLVLYVASHGGASWRDELGLRSGEAPGVAIILPGYYIRAKDGETRPQVWQDRVWHRLTDFDSEADVVSLVERGLRLVFHNRQTFSHTEPVAIHWVENRNSQPVAAKPARVGSAACTNLWAAGCGRQACS
jgi:hypothetical protein